MAKRSATRLDRFLSKFCEDPVSLCWNWTGSKFGNGYGWFHNPGGSSSAHRVSYEIFYGLELPNYIEIRHLCHNPGCVNPSHIEPGSHIDTMRDMVAAGRSRGGEIHPQAKITDADMSEMILLRKRGMMVKDIAAKFNISPSQASRLTRNKRT